MSSRDTIFATSSGVPPAAIAIIRISGPAACDIAKALIGPSSLPAPRYAALRALRHPGDGALLDRALVLIFPKPHSATGEDLAELHVHGGKAVVSAVEAAIAIHPCARRAEPGEFTRRALQNGLIDLTGAEGLADLLTAETETQRRAAIRIAEGALRARIDTWTARLVRIAARIEAQLDFSDEDDVADEGLDAILIDLAKVTAEVDTLLQQAPVERLRDGVRVVIAGPPNSGKSTLLNALAGREAAIVSPISGTTRDRIEAPVVRSGIAYVLTDTAGITPSPSDEIERIGIRLAEAAIADADIVLWLGDGDTPSTRGSIRVHARADLPGRQVSPPGADVSISVSTGRDLDALWALIARQSVALLPHEDALATNQRQRHLLHQVSDSLGRGAETRDPLLLAEELRIARGALHAITGRSGVEDVLDALFASFCIGK